MERRDHRNTNIYSYNMNISKMTYEYSCRLNICKAFQRIEITMNRE